MSGTHAFGALRWMSVVLDLPVGHTPTATFWEQITAARLTPGGGEGRELATLTPARGDPHVRVQWVAGRGGTHFDLHAVDPGSWAARARAHGAGARHTEAGFEVLGSPGGFAFCVVGWQGEADAAPAVPGPSGGSSRLDQVCLDIPAEAFASEVEFWAGLTGWELVRASRPEFALLRPPRGLPVRLLLQRLDRSAPGEPVSAHIDIAAGPTMAQVAETAVWHASLGAQPGSTYEFWQVMLDPSGRVYCLTMRDPETGRIAL